MFCSIYKITNALNGKRYIGRTWEPLSERLRNHCRKNSCRKLYNALHKYGVASFKIELITVAHTQEVADYWERHFIKSYNTIESGYNLRDGGSRGKHSPLTIAKMKAAPNKGRFKKGSMGRVGQKVSEAGKRRMALAKLGSTLTAEHKANISAAIKGKHWKLVDGKRVYY